MISTAAKSLADSSEAFRYGVYGLASGAVAISGAAVLYLLLDSFTGVSGPVLKLLYLFSGPVVGAFLWILSQEFEMSMVPWISSLVLAAALNPWNPEPMLVPALGVFIVAAAGYSLSGWVGAVSLTFITGLGAALSYLAASFTASLATAGFQLAGVAAEVTAIHGAPVAVPLGTAVYAAGYSISRGL